MKKVTLPSRDNNVIYINDPYFYSDVVDNILLNKTRSSKINGVSLKSVIDAIKNNKYVIIYRERCGYSIRARNKLKDSGVKYVEIDIDDINVNREELNKALSEENFDFPKSYRTLPMIFKNQKFIGGSDQLSNHL